MPKQIFASNYKQTRLLRLQYGHGIIEGACVVPKLIDRLI